MWTLIIIIIIFVVLYCFASSSDRSRRAGIQRNIQKSNGTLDSNAKKARAELRNIKEKTAKDVFDTAEITRLNELENDLCKATTASIVEIAQDYTTAIQQWQPTENPAFVLGRIEETERQIQALGGYDALGDGALGDDDYMMRAIIGLNQAVEGNTLREQNADHRLAEAFANSETRAEAVDKYLESSKTQTSDAQNVHDTSVIRDLNKTLMELRSTMPTGYLATTAINDARQYCNDEYRREYGDGKAGRAQRCLDLITAGSNISSFNTTEDEIFAATWARCDYKPNTRNRKNMRDGIMHALADSIEGANPVCLNGRCGRVLSSLVTLDYNTEVGSAMTLEAYRNQIFSETSKIIAEEVETAKDSNNPKLRQAALAFDSGDNTDESGDTMLHERIQRAVNNNIQTYSDKIPFQDLQIIQRECAYVM